VWKSGVSHSNGSCGETSCKPAMEEECKRGPPGNPVSRNGLQEPIFSVSNEGAE
jgi:hypothetical protein